MSDSAALLQNSAVANKVGLARHRPLAINTNPKDAKSKSSLPDGWYFNETKENEFWEDIEKSSGDQSLPVVTPKNESKPSIQESTIEDLKKKIQDLQNKIQKQNEISEDLQKKLNQTEEEKEELSTSIQKHLQNLVDERTKALSSNKNINDQSTTNRSELYELQMKHQNEIREINNIHRQEIFQVQELSRKKLSQERERILKEIGDGNSQALIKSISDEAEKQIEELKKEFETQRQNIIEEWAGKVTLLTRQYENRIKTLNSQHEMDLIMKKDDINSEITSKKIQIENEFNEKVLKLNEENNKIINEYENQITKINNNLQNKKIENQNLKKQLGIETNENDEVEEDKNDNNIIQKQIIKNDNFKEFEDYAMKYKIMKDEMEEQSNWALKNQKRYYKKKIEKVATDAQKQMREKLMEIQEKMLEMKNDENPKNKIEDLINDVSNTFEGMNNTIEEVVNDLNENEPTIPIKESNERIEELRNKIIELRNEIQTLKNENKNINNNVKQSKENEIKKTKLTKSIIFNEVNVVPIKEIKEYQNVQSISYSEIGIITDKYEPPPTIIITKQTPETKEQISTKITLSEPLIYQKIQNQNIFLKYSNLNVIEVNNEENVENSEPKIIIVNTPPKVQLEIPKLKEEKTEIKNEKVEKEEENHSDIISEITASLNVDTELEELKPIKQQKIYQQYDKEQIQEMRNRRNQSKSSLTSSQTIIDNVNETIPHVTFPNEEQNNNNETTLHVTFPSEEQKQNNVNEKQNNNNNETVSYVSITNKEQTQQNNNEITNIETKGQNNNKSENVSNNEKDKTNQIKNSEIIYKEIPGDPYTSSLHLIQSLNHYINGYNEDTNKILNDINVNIIGYDSYITNLNPKDETHYSFIQRIKQNKNELDQQNTKITNLLTSNDTLIKYLNKMKSNYDNLKNQFIVLQNEKNKQEIEIQQEIINEISTQRNDPTIPSSITQLENLQKIESSFEVLDNLGLIKDSNSLIMKDEILNNIKQVETKLIENKDINEEEINKIIINSKEFMSGIKNNTQIPTIEIPQEEEINDNNNNNKLISDLKRIRKQRNKLQQEIESEKIKNEMLTTRNIQLMNKLKERTEIKQIDESALKTQLDNMNEIFNNITNDNKVIDIKQLKEQISNMKTIIETTQAQRDMYKAQAEDNEISLTKAEDSILVLKNQINELIQNDEINSKNYNSKDIEQIFNDVELKKLRYEREQDLKKGQEQNKEMEKTLAQNIQLVTRNMELEKEITKLQNEHQKALNTIEEMSIQNSLFKNPIDNEIPSKDTSDKCIQCNFVKDKEEINEVQTITKNQKENSPRKTKNSSTKNQNNFEKEIIKQQNIQNDKEEELINDKLEENENKNQKIDEIIEPIQNEENNLLQNDKSTEITSDINIKQEEQNDIQQQNSQINLNNINNSEEIDDFDQSFETFSTNIEKIMNDLTPQNFEIVPHTVHQPLQWSKKKKLRIPTISDNKNPQSKTPKTQLRLKHPPSLHNNTNNNKDNENIDQSLTIGGAKQGQRQIRGVHGNIKPLRTSMQLINYENQTEATKQNIENLPDILSSYTQNININNNNNERTSSPVHATTNANALSPAHTTTNANASSPAHVTTNSKNVDVPPLVPGSLEANPPAPLRITLVVHQNQVVKEKKPIVIPPNEAQTTTKPIQSVSGTILRQQQIINSTSNEALKAITKLKDQIHKLQEINEKKDSNIIELREKVNDLMINNHRLKVDNIKHIDDLKRSEIHCENLKSRLDICFKELISRDEEIKQLKRQILLLKNYTLPVTKSINNINNVNKEKERIKKEKLQRLNITKMTENALKETENEELKSHLNLILRNQQLSIKKLEEQRKMWSEIEKKNLMAVLSSMSLLSDSNYDKIINNLPKNSPFKSSRVNAMDFVKRINKISFNGEEEDLEEFDNLNDDNKRKQVMPYTKKLELIGKANKEQLDDGKIKDIVERKDSHEVQKVLMEIEHKDKEENRLKNELIRPT